jgi:asparagine synthase (glutamine-hydrolysing)
MCGIAGLYCFRSGRPVLCEEMAAMAARLAHRGPDDEGVFTDGPLGFAHRRLTILDTSRRGRQPMATRDGAFTITYNGEVYNFLELKNELQGRGHRFRTKTDTEVLLHLYQERGDGFLQALNGMFAFALWDRPRRRLLLARDRLGVKPLYYTWTADGLAFASEVKALLAVPGVRAEVDLEMLDAYMSVGYVPTERTLFRGILKLQPGWAMQIEDGRVNLFKYWDLDPRPEPVSEERCIQEVTALLQDAVRLQLRSDVPLGVFLSGGIDSSAVVALMRKLGVEDIETFTVAYDFGPGFDETRYARRVAERFATRHHEIYVTPEAFRDFIPSLVYHMEEPVTEAAATALHFVARLARERVTVVLSGEGSDEVFGGYPIYSYMAALERYRRLPEPLREGILNPLLARLGGKWSKYTELSRFPLPERYLGVSFYEAPVKEALYRPEVRGFWNGSAMPGLVARYYRPTEGRDPISRMMGLDVKSWLPDDLLIKADKMTMAASLELRVPFLDHRIVELGARIPPRLKVRGFTTKYILKKAMEPYLPRDILHRPKMGFPTPLARMFKGKLAEYVADVLGSASCLGRGYFRPEEVERRVDEHLSGARDHHRVLWQLLVLEEWHRRFIDGSGKGAEGRLPEQAGSIVGREVAAVESAAAVSPP